MSRLKNGLDEMKKAQERLAAGATQPNQEETSFNKVGQKVALQILLHGLTALLRWSTAQNVKYFAP